MTRVLGTTAECSTRPSAGKKPPRKSVAATQASPLVFPAALSRSVGAPGETGSETSATHRQRGFERGTPRELDDNLPVPRAAHHDRVTVASLRRTCPHDRPTPGVLRASPSFRDIFSSVQGVLAGLGRAYAADRSMLRGCSRRPSARSLSETETVSPCNMSTPGAKNNGARSGDPRRRQKQELSSEAAVLCAPPGGVLSGTKRAVGTLWNAAATRKASHASAERSAGYEPSAHPSMSQQCVMAVPRVVRRRDEAHRSPNPSYPADGTRSPLPPMRLEGWDGAAYLTRAALEELVRAREESHGSDDSPCLLWTLPMAQWRLTDTDALATRTPSLARQKRIRDASCLGGASMASRTRRFGCTTPLSQVTSRQGRTDSEQRGQGVKKVRGTSEVSRAADGKESAAVTGEEEDAGAGIGERRTCAGKCKRDVEQRTRRTDRTATLDDDVPHDAVWTTTAGLGAAAVAADLPKASMMTVPRSRNPPGNNIRCFLKSLGYRGNLGANADSYGLGGG
ncbi:hypothetical protein HPB47_007797 [Ixodes persulcatus]|uniref:Uncharacterized protein n=1 Tax=Ixodes persulcatus TaxID=34615 RepID=A0AC60P6H6_IXOPE|nr:hypothetical protein HPB47_007797 [Ixodes persulcatus]